MDTEKEKAAIEHLKRFEPKNRNEPYFLAYSGGKDSDCIKILAYLAGVKFEAVHSSTTVDAPETYRYIKSQPDVKIEYPFYNMWQLIEMKGIPPTRLIRYCCSDLKECGGECRVVVTGVRWAESKKRKESSGLVKIIGKPKTTEHEAIRRNLDYIISNQGGMILNDDNDNTRDFVDHCYRTHKVMINPIVDWSDDDVWDFLKYYGCDSNPLYQCGFKRIGCIGCPIAGKHRYREFEKYPKYKENYIRAFDRMLKTRERNGLSNHSNWDTGKDVFKWWMGENPLQLTFDDLIELGLTD